MMLERLRAWWFVFRYRKAIMCYVHEKTDAYFEDRT